MKDFLTKWQEGLCAHYNTPHNPVTDVTTYDELISYVPVEAKKVLEIGAGSGYIIQKLQEKGIQAIGTTLCQEDAQKYGLVFQDMHDLPYEDNDFDVVIAKHVLEHALSPRLVIREVHRILKEGGLFLVEVPVSLSGVEGDNRAHFYCWTPLQWLSFIMNNGFERIREEYSGSSYRLVLIKGEMNE